MIPVRYDRAPQVTAVFPAAGLPDGTACPACDQPLAAEPVALVYVGPGPDPEDRAKSAAGRWHTGAAVAVHAVCAGVQETTP